MTVTILDARCRRSVPSITASPGPSTTWCRTPAPGAYADSPRCCTPTECDLRTYRPSTPFAAALCRGVLNDVLGAAARDAVCATLARALVPGGVLLLDVRDWGRSAARKRAEPVTRRTARTTRGRLSFRSDTRLDRPRRRLVLREQIRMTSARRDVVVTNTFVMGCWTRAELRRRLRRAGFASVRYLPAARAALPSDRLFAVATR